MEGGHSSDSVRVVARFRPFNQHQAKTRGNEVDTHGRPAMSGKPITANSEDDDSFLLEFVDERSINLRVPAADKGGGKRKPVPYTLDRIFGADSTQDQVFADIAAPTVNDVLKGYNGTIFAYGQTGSGKTHTMFGVRGGPPELRGLIPRAAHAIFEGIEKLDDVVEVTITCSFLEIYREQIRDLLAPKNIGLKVREAPSGDVYVQGLSDEFVTSPDELLDVVAEGDKSRSVAATNMNETSSRSHSVLIVIVTQKCRDGSVKVGKLNLADLAGSERIAHTGATGQTLEEAKKINQSLSSLGNCINALTDKSRSHIPYRDSTLTYLLKDSLGGNTKTTLVICCSSDPYNGLETITTLKFGLRAKSVKNTAKVNKQKSVAELEAMVSNLRGELLLASKHNVLLRSLVSEMHAYAVASGYGDGAPHDPSSGAPPKLPPAALAAVSAAIDALREAAGKIPLQLSDADKLAAKSAAGTTDASDKAAAERERAAAAERTAAAVAAEEAKRAQTADTTAPDEGEDDDALSPWGAHDDDGEPFAEPDNRALSQAGGAAAMSLSALSESQFQDDVFRYQEKLAEADVRVRELTAANANLEDDLKALREKLREMSKQEELRLQKAIMDTTREEAPPGAARMQSVSALAKLCTPKAGGSLGLTVDEEDAEGGLELPESGGFGDGDDEDAASPWGADDDEGVAQQAEDLRQRVSNSELTMDQVAAAAAKDQKTIADLLAKNKDLQAQIAEMKATWTRYLDMVMESQLSSAADVKKAPKIVKPVRAKRSFMTGGSKPGSSVSSPLGAGARPSMGGLSRGVPLASPFSPKSP
jgi:hypothetical protein